MKKCPECNTLNDAAAQSCTNCGYPFSEDEQGDKDVAEILNQNNVNERVDNSMARVEITHDTKKRISKKIIFGCIAGVALLCVIGIFIYMTSDLRKYQVANRYSKNKKYEKALDLYTELGDYKDSKEKYVEVEHAYMVSTDDIPPTIENVPEEVRIKMGDSFNAEEWLTESDITATDDVTQNIKCGVETQDVNTS